jgi:hypothetical protein
VGYAAVAALRTNHQSTEADPAAAPEVLASIVARPHLVFLHAPTGDTYRRVAVAPLDALDGPRYLTALQCQRVYVAASQGLCLGNNYLGGIISAYNAYSFDEAFQVGHTYDQAGLPSRVRLSPDGRLGAMTVFVAGHSYADAGFSTQTTLVDTGAGAPIADLEQFRVVRDGEPFQAADFNFWGVTFARDGNRFYATLGTAGRTYLVEGDLAERQARVLRENVECPSLSPDNTHLAFKKRVNANPRDWRLTVLDLRSMQESSVGEARSVDDQAEWLDDQHLLYTVQDEGTIGTSIWEATLGGAAAPRMLLPQAMSPAVVR